MSDFEQLGAFLGLVPLGLLGPLRPLNLHGLLQKYAEILISMASHRVESKTGQVIDEA